VAEKSKKLKQLEVDEMIYTVRTTVGQEGMVIDLLGSKTKHEQLNVYSLTSIPGLKGYVLIEADNELTIRRAITNVPHIKGRGLVMGSVKLEELSASLEAKPLMKAIEEGSKVEIIAGPFKGEKAKVLRVNQTKEEVTIELQEAAVKIPLTIKAEHTRVIKG
jgi:transcriptional antiterminator NusG